MGPARKARRGGSALCEHDRMPALPPRANDNPAAAIAETLLTRAAAAKRSRTEAVRNVGAVTEELAVKLAEGDAPDPAELVRYADAIAVAFAASGAARGAFWHKVATGRIKCKHASGDPNWWLSFVSDLVSEARKLICDGRAYSKQKRGLQRFVDGGIGAVAGTIAASAGVTQASAMAIAALVFAVAFAMGRAAFCRRAASQLEKLIRRKIALRTGWSNDEDEGKPPRKTRRSVTRCVRRANP
jgi:hypothetical protein